MKLLKTVSMSLFLLANAAFGQEPQPFAISDDPTPKTEPAKPDQNNESEKEDDEETVPLNTQWLMFTAPWCVYCRNARSDFEPWMRRSGWVIDETPAAHVRMIDGDRRPDLVRQMRVMSYPTFILLQDNRELTRFEGYPGRKELVRRFRHAVETAPPVTGTISAGTLKGQRENIVRLISTMRPLLGNNGTLTVKLDRLGTPALNLPLGDRLANVSDNPLVMSYTLKNDVLTCRFAEPYPRGRFTFGLSAEQAITAISFSAAEVVIELPRAPDVRLNVEP